MEDKKKEDKYFFKKGNKYQQKGSAGLRYGGTTPVAKDKEKNLERLRCGWKPKTLICKDITISDDEEAFANEFSAKVSEQNDTYVDTVLIELAIAQILQVHRVYAYAKEKKISRDASRMIGTVLSTLREMNATKNARKVDNIQVNVNSDIMTLIQQNLNLISNDDGKKRNNILTK